MNSITAGCDWLSCSILDLDLVRADMDSIDANTRSALREAGAIKDRAAKGYSQSEIIPLPLIHSSDTFPKLLTAGADVGYVDFNYNEDFLDFESGEVNKGYGLIQLSGRELYDFNWLSFLKTRGLLSEGTGRITRFDLPLDIDFGEGEDACLKKDDFFRKLIKAFAFDIETGKVDNKKSILESGIDAFGKKSKIYTVSITASNGTTIYIGSRQSQFMLRIYDKTAEHNAKVPDENKLTNQIVRCELELKDALATTVVNDLMRRYNNTSDIEVSYLLRVWQTLVNSKMRFRFRNDKTRTFFQQFGLGDNAEMIPFDYIKFDRKQLEKLAWLKNQVGPTMRTYIMANYNPKSEADWTDAVLDLLRKMDVISNDVSCFNSSDGRIE